MKRAIFLCLVAGLASVLFSCERYPDGCGVIKLSLSDDYRYDNLKDIFNPTKAVEGVIPDTNQFVLNIVSDAGNVVYNGLYGASSKEFEVTAGTYHLSVVSEPFSKPTFASPQYGDAHTIYVADGENVGVEFACKQVNAGIKLKYSRSFLSKFGGQMFMFKSEQGDLTYGENENRIAYFLPGRVQFLAGSASRQTIIFTRDLIMGEILVMTLSASEDPSENQGHLSISLDTTRVWQSENFMVGQGTDGSTEEKALSVNDLSAWLGAEDVWVTGFIVGGDVSSSSFNNRAPFKTPSNLAISNSLTANIREQVAAVELKSGSMRESLNLVDNPDNVGRTLLLKGDVVNYFSHPGVKNVSEYKFVY